MNNHLYRGFWRWHFYGGLIVLPFLAWLAITGSLYLFKPEIERAYYGDWINLSAPRQALPVSQLVAGVERQTEGKVTQIELPASPSESWRFRVDLDDQAQTAFVDPSNGAILGTTSAGGIMKTVRDLHSLAITGKLGNALIEVAAGWAVILVVTGIVLWWPRGGQPVVALRGAASGRRFWRDLHASTGFIAGTLILFLALTGMPWSGVWGASVQRIVAEQGLGRPPAPGKSHHGASKHHGAMEAQRQSLPWSLQAGAVPAASQMPTRDLDRAVRTVAARGLVAPMTIGLPVEAGQPYSFSRTVRQAQDAHVIYVDPASGRILQDSAFASFGTGAKVIEWGVATHQGQQYGEPNRWVMLAGCIALLMLCISAPILWWKRRDTGGLALPPLPRDRQKAALATMITVALGLFYPLTGASILLVMLLDRLLLRERSSVLLLRRLQLQH